MTNLRMGHGYDVHRLTAGRPLILGGVHVPYDRGLDGHSDADVLTHAVMDALLGAAALGVDPGCVNVKATTEEHLGFTGNGSGMSAHAVALIERV